MHFACIRIRLSTRKLCSVVCVSVCCATRERRRTSRKCEPSRNHCKPNTSLCKPMRTHATQCDTPVQPMERQWTVMQARARTQKGEAVRSVPCKFEYICIYIYIYIYRERERDSERERERQIHLYAKVVPYTKP